MMDVAREVFSERNGFVLCNPARLDGHHGGSARGLDLLHLYSTSPLGDAVAASGAAIPVMDLETAKYTIIVRKASEPSLITRPYLVSTGWILHAGAEPLALCSAGYLAHWNPDHPKVLRPRVAPGWYEVKIVGGFDKPTNDDWILEFVLHPSREPPTLSADLRAELRQAH